MTADDETKPRSSLAVWLILICVPMAYALTIGPACWLSTHYVLGEQGAAVLKAFYTPLELVANSCLPLSRLLKWYIELWLD